MDQKTITAAVTDAFQMQDARSAVLVHGLIRHLHDLVREVGLTHAEWRAALRFLTDSARITDDARNEFSLLSDILGVSSLVDLLHSTADATPGSVLGPFHVHDSHWRDNGVDLAGGQAGMPTLFHGHVRSTHGEPLQAEIDFWQNADNALYPQQDALQDPHNLRCKLRTDAQGAFTVRTVRPQPYGVPEDGPVGRLLKQAGRTCMRPAHFHAIVTAAGHRPVVTEIFPADDPYLERDAVFGVRAPLCVPFTLCSEAAMVAAAGMPGPYLDVHFDFRLEPLDTRLPAP